MKEMWQAHTKSDDNDYRGRSSCFRLVSFFDAEAGWVLRAHSISKNIHTPAAKYTRA